jgi:hypothetical protein
MSLGQLDANVASLDIESGKEVWGTATEAWCKDNGMSGAPLFAVGARL